VNHFIPPHFSDTEDAPVVSAQDEFDDFTTKKGTETRTDNVLDAKSEATPEIMADNIAEPKMTNVQPKASTSKARKSTKTSKPTTSDSQANDMDTSM
jgi:hypothetical protein